MKKCPILRPRKPDGLKPKLPKHSFQSTNPLPIISKTHPDLNRDVEQLFKATSTTSFENLFRSDRNVKNI